jgi:predicted  nucleic acid-binding Zn-ribbon protein
LALLLIVMNLFKKKLSDVSDNEEFEALKTEHTDLLSEFNSMREELKTAQEEASSYQLRYTELHEEHELLKVENESLKTDSALLASEQATVDLKAAEKAAEIVAEHIGDTPIEITQDEPELSLKENLSQLKGAELVEFYNKNKEDIFKALKTNK